MISFLKTLLLLSAAGTMCGLLLAALRKLSKGKIPNTFLYAAWIVVLFRFAIPVNGLIPIDRANGNDIVPEPVYTEPSQVYPREETTVEAFAYVHTNTPDQYAPEYYVPEQPGDDLPVSAAAPADEKAFPFPTVLFFIWCSATVFFLLLNLTSYFRFASSLKKSLLRPLRHDVDIYDEVCSSRRPKLRRSRMISAPLTFGIIKPVLVIPDTEYGDTALKYVFAHELIHFRRHDIPIKWITLFIFSAHWFNPFVWYFRKEIDRVCELSCDETLLKRLNKEEKRGYGETLLNIAESSCGVQHRMVTGFSKGKTDLKERLLQIMTFKKKSKIAIAMALVPVLVLCGCAVALGPKADKTPDADPVTVSNVDELLAAIAPNAEIHLAVGTYNLTEAADYGKDESGTYYYWNNNGYEDQFELCIEDVDGLSIIGDNAEILTVPRSSNVLAFRNCNDLSLRGLTVGHTEAAGHCEGGVIRLDACDDALIDSCRLYGCGTIGVWAEGCGDLKVSDTEIHHCSSAGISYQYATGLKVEGCRIYDCGKPEIYQEAAAVFIFFDARDIVLRNCDIHDNYLQTFLQGNGRETFFEDIRIYDNHISSVFHYDGDARFSDASFTGNTVDKWMAEGRSGAILIDGNRVTEDELSAMWGEQMSSAGVGAVQAEAVQADHTGAREVHVSTADEFLAAIDSDTHIIIDVPMIDLTEASEYPANGDFDNATPRFDGKPYAWQYVYDGSALCLGSLYNFHISGGEIVTQPRYANVLSFYECKNISLTGVHLGHNKLPGVCMGGVLYLEGCENVILESCDLYGCGILGVQTRHVSELHVQNTVIHDCSNGGAVLEETNEAVFLGCDIVNCPSPHFSLRGCENFSWDGKLMDPHSAFNVNDDARNPFEEALNSVAPTSDLVMQPGSEKSTALNVACIVVDAYVKGYDGFERIIQGHLSRTSAIGVFGEITACDFPVYYEIIEERNFSEDTSLNLDRVRHLASKGLISAEDIVPVEMVQICRMDGIDEITGDEPEGATRTICIYFRTSTDHPEQESSYFIVDLIREDGCWRVVRF